MKKLISTLLLLALLLSTIPASAFSFGELGDAMDAILGTGEDEPAEEADEDVDLFSMSFRDAVDMYVKIYMDYIDAMLSLYADDVDDAIDGTFDMLGDVMIWAEKMEQLEAFEKSIDEDDLSAEDYEYWLEAELRLLEYIAEVGFEED